MNEEYFEEEIIKSALQSCKNLEEKRKIRAAAIKNNCLTRYRRFDERTIDALKRDRLYFSTALGYNDPYDTLMYVDYNKLFNYIKQCWEKGMPSFIEHLHYQNAFLANISQFLLNDKNPQKSKMEESFFQFLQSEIETLKNKLHENVKGICFSTDMLSSLMWAHYADNHQGIALLYDRKELLSAPCYNNDDIELNYKFELGNINYSQQRIDATKYINDYLLKNMPSIVPYTASEPNRKTLKDIILTKDVSWSYEKEIRLFPRKLDFEKENDISYLSIRPKAIIMGSKITEDNIYRIKDIAKKKNIILYEAWLNERQQNYEIVFQEYGV